MLYNMASTQLVNRREVVAEDAFIEVVIWRLPRPLPPSEHRFKYRLAYVVAETCVLRYDNERGKGDHRHSLRSEEPYRFLDVDRLLRDFEADVARWNHENGRT